ncbi:MAG: hypothetical protein A3D65_05620 [Candidatus Lloydbacteria bacterium RIFCSPHIGHO2_02_FULL_50_13]|uniref:Deoxynucleoside kinase domain-containing protein n=1 Tax=Candidatus Lloydbacteria bacterium RIFCSPHIGHO2_02_FULL_50_13 TaxID=1798661 RepID=A0A1G2D5R7_9BACT|nr:MAG: hypothetical protein A3D65_05620 [Candidatus Lloydbacteria bacterium RIFCSPHIGHO2_02_FULL_50_13]
MKKQMLGFAGEFKAGKSTATTRLKVWYPGTRSSRYSDPLREFLVGFNEMKSRNMFCMVSDELLVGKHVTDALPKIFSTKVAELGDKEKQREFVAWLVNTWFNQPELVKEDRHNLQELSTAVRSIFAENILERTIVARVGRMRTKSPIVVVEGIRRLVDIGILLLSPNFHLTYIEIDPMVAYQRMVKQNENVGDAEMTFERFMELRNAEAEQQTRFLKPHAHLVIDNSGPPEVMERILRAEVAKWLAP